VSGRKERCPNCGSTKVIPIVYGDDQSNLEEKEKKGELILGGMPLDEESPYAHCCSCGYEW